MPSIVGNFEIVLIVTGSILNTGDSLIMTPTGVTKTFAGSGSFNIGDFAVAVNPVSETATLDDDIVNQQQISRK